MVSIPIFSSDNCIGEILLREELTELLAKLNELGTTSDEHFKHEYMCTFAISEKEKTLNELAIRYRDECEAYDKTVCTGGMKYGEIMPSNPSEMRLIDKNARNVLKKLLESEVAFNHEINRRELMKEISRIGR